MSPHLERISQSAMPPMRPRRYTYIEPPDLHASVSPRRYTCSAPPELHTSMLPHLHVCTAPPRLQRSIPPSLQCCTLPCSSKIQFLRPSTSPPLQRSSN